MQKKLRLSSSTLSAEADSRITITIQIIDALYRLFTYIISAERWDVTMPVLASPCLALHLTLSIPPQSLVNHRSDATHLPAKMPLSNAMLLGLETNLLLKSELFYVKQYKNTPASRKQNSEFFKIQKLLENPNEFFKYMRMTKKVFEYIFENTEDVLNGLLINVKTISAREKLFITIR